MLNEQKAENHNSSVDDLWEKSLNSEVLIDLKKGEPLNEVIEKNFNPEKKISLDRIECSDGRCPHQGNDFSIAGSGILLSDEEFDKLIKEFPDLKKITAHSDCGAAKLAFAKLEEEGKLPEDITTPQEYAVYWTKNKAQQYGLEYEYIDEPQFQASNHHERGLLIDDTGSFHSAYVDGMPNVFVSHSASAVDKNYVAKEAEVLTGIAMGHHGFGNRLSPDQPFYIMVCSKDDKSMNDLVSKVSDATAAFKDRVKVEGFISPEK